MRVFIKVLSMNFGVDKNSWMVVALAACLLYFATVYYKCYFYAYTLATYYSASATRLGSGQVPANKQLDNNPTRRETVMDE